MKYTDITSGYIKVQYDTYRYYIQFLVKIAELDPNMPAAELHWNLASLRAEAIKNGVAFKSTVAFYWQTIAKDFIAEFTSDKLDSNNELYRLNLMTIYSSANFPTLDKLYQIFNPDVFDIEEFILALAYISYKQDFKYDFDTKETATWQSLFLYSRAVLKMR